MRRPERKDRREKSRFLRFYVASDTAAALAAAAEVFNATISASLSVETLGRGMAVNVSRQPLGRSLAGGHLGSYEIVSLLGAGGMGEVY